MVSGVQNSVSRVCFGRVGKSVQCVAAAGGKPVRQNARFGMLIPHSLLPRVSINSTPSGTSLPKYALDRLSHHPRLWFPCEHLSNMAPGMVP